MSGHSKWSTIKHKKAATDQKRAAVFSKLLKAVAIAAKDNSDPSANPRLRSAIDKAKASNVPLKNIEKAMSKTTDSAALSELMIEAYGPGGSALIISAITDNKNRTIPEVKKILQERGSKHAEQGGVLWSFEKKDGEFEPNFQQELGEKDLEKLADIVENLEAHPDVTRVVTNAA